ncbi:MAG: aminoglycoside 6-adenylyltransferase [Anaerolineae bacterium]|nr:aminoglycoside 6-adenylyltransferase [Anaerolineae bacterium]
MEIRHPHLDKVVHWARGEAAIRAVVITGSLARADGSVDDYSDLDAQIITRDIKRLTRDDSWLDSLGEVWIRFPLRQDAPYRLLWFAGGFKVDFQFVQVDDILAMRESGELSDEYLRGYQVALDKDGLYASLPPSPREFPLPALPSEAELATVTNEFWFEAIHVAQFIRRREFWVAKFRDWTMKEDLLRLIEWHARATGKAEVNTWLLGKRITQWADADTAAAITKIWPRWDAAEMWRALLIQLELCRRLSRELHTALGFDYAEAKHLQIEQYIRQLYAEDAETR